MLVLRLWLLLGVAVVAGWIVWNFVPVLIPMLVVLIGLGAISTAMIRLARWIEQRRAAGAEEGE